MIRHLLKLVWNRKWSNLLLILEIFFSFIVVLVVASFGIFFARNYARPLGFSYENLWSVTIESLEGGDGWTEGEARTLDNLLRELEAMPQILSAGAALGNPYQMDIRRTSVQVGERTRTPEFEQMTDRMQEVLELELVTGRWFEDADDALNWRPVVLDRHLSRRLFGDDDSLGRSLQVGGGSTEHRVVGVVADVRLHGELSSPDGLLIQRKSLQKPEGSPLRTVLLRLKGGTPAGFEVDLHERMRRLARGWSFEITPVEKVRRGYFRLRLAPLMAGALVAGFLLLIVALGLSGVMWQNIARRRREIGLRRAVGATAHSVQRQILLELVILTSLGLLLGCVIAVQLPFLGLIGPLSGGVFAAGIAVALLVMFLLTLLCGFYPSWMGTRVDPAEALRYD